MNDIRNALKKAGLVSKKDEKRFRHQERTRKKELGREGRKAEELRQAEEVKRREEQKRRQVRSAQQRHDAQLKQSEEARAAFAQLHNQALRTGIDGPRRFHYREEPTGYLPYLQVNDHIGRRLEAGELAIVAHPDQERQVAIVPRDVAQQVRNVRPELIRHLL